VPDARSGRAYDYPPEPFALGQLEVVIGPDGDRIESENENRTLTRQIARALEQAVAQPVLLCSPALWPHLYRMFSRVLPHLGVLAHAGVPSHVHVVPVATLE
jgi:flagellar biosynthesis component FlhA